LSTGSINHDLVKGLHTRIIAGDRYLLVAKLTTSDDLITQLVGYVGAGITISSCTN
jgi:hypothetical protein